MSVYSAFMFREIEEKWQRAWEEAGIFQADPDDRPKFFITIPYPYLNGNLHVGHCRTFTIGDAIARYKRMCGFNVLFPMGFHVTGTPIIGLAELIKKRDPRTIEVYTKYHDVPKDILLTLTTPERIVEYFAKEAEKALKDIGYSIDWRRKFTTTDEPYQKFIEWQFWKLKEKGLIVKGSHPVRFCPNCNNPVEDHDLLMGEEATIVDYTVIKFYMPDDEFGKIIFPCATLRPETVFGVTNIWVKPTTYVLAKVDGELWFISKECAEKLRYQERNIEILREVNAEEFIGKFVVNPVTGKEVPILPAEFVDTDNATGVVMSVPAHAPYDYVAIEDLKRNEEILRKYGIEDVVKSIEPIVLIRIEDEDYDIPAKDVVEKLGIKNQSDPNLEKATKIVYKKEYHKGVLLDVTGKYAGMKVSEVKEVIQRDLIQQGIGDVFYEFSEKPVVCRCGTKCVVKVVRDQWFIRYSDEEWKRKVLDWLEKMTIIPDYYKEEFRNKIEWLKDKACARRRGLGTRIPWDKEWLIESLSDSTIYMAYYILAKFINEGKLKAENITQEFLDYVLLGIGKAEDAAKSSGLDVKTVEDVRKDFKYWYPVDLRSSGKDLVANHLLFFLFHHVAIFPPKHWPRAIAVNGYVSLEGKKMSKSKGPLLTMKRAVAENGADVTRLYILYASEYDSDADWRSKEVEAMKRHLERFFELVKEHYTKEIKEIDHLDRWLISRFQKAVKETRDAMEKLQTRRAVNSAFFEVLNDIRWYLKRGGDNLAIILDDWIKLLAPFIPHICEELWHLKHDSFVSLESYPEYDESKIDEKAEAIENYLKNFIEDVKEVMKFFKGERVYVAFAEDWKVEALKVALDSDSMKSAMAELMKYDKFKKMAKEVSAFLKRVFRDKDTFKEIVGIDERKIIEENKEFIEGELGVKIVLDESAVPEDRRKQAMPGKPAIYVEG
ncbi:leucyl-tRNA synthetase [Archaeoglobus profundus DSM 5631]|uniref:Leucine--tRNA ligase n=2 Tax=Archaeoglobus profundus TaxID=84156 RepID=D2RDZ4_ARCPA|nr:leucyl-tRNA synthetase [Archaeoglobus profundus DSM 5631]